MAKWYGMIGYGKTVETAPSVFTEKIVERPYFGDIGRDTRRLQTSGTKWKITDVEVQFPRLILSLGSEYNAH